MQRTHYIKNRAMIGIAMTFVVLILDKVAIRQEQAMYVYLCGVKICGMAFSWTRNMKLQLESALTHSKSISGVTEANGWLGWQVSSLAPDRPPQVPHPNK